MKSFRARKEGFNHRGHEGRRSYGAIVYGGYNLNAALFAGADQGRSSVPVLFLDGNTEVQLGDLFR